MMDADFIKNISDLHSAGDLKARNEAIQKHGGMDRLIALALRGVTRANNAQKKTRGTFIPEDFPDAHARELAVAYWRKNRRPDLEASIERIIDNFIAHHADCRAVSWVRTWGTWYRNQVDFIRPARNSELTLATVAFEQTTVTGWASRLAVFYGNDEECPEGTWSPKWGPTPTDKGNRVPPEALAAFEAQFGRKRAKS